MIIIIKFIHIFEYAVHIIFTAMKKTGYESQWDSKDDQTSSRLGIFHAEKNQYRRYRK